MSDNPQPPTEARELTEKDRRIYYQGLVYDVCNIVDRYMPEGKKVYCGSAEAPTNNFIQHLEQILKESTPTAREVLEEVLSDISKHYYSEDMGGCEAKVLYHVTREIIAKQLEKVGLGKGGE